MLLAVSVAAPPAFAQSPSPAEKRIDAARAKIAKSPGASEGYNALALALTRRARETADTEYYAKAEDALEMSFDLAPDNFAGQKIQVWVLLGQHEFERALEKAKALNRRAPDDVMVYGLLTDAHVELGDYEAAEKAAQWMLDLRPGNLPGVTRGAYLRELFGDIDGALEWMRRAYEQTYFNENEERAWLLTQVAHLERSRGAIGAAEEAAEHALELFPDTTTRSRSSRTSAWLRASLTKLCLFSKRATALRPTRRTSTTWRKPNAARDEALRPRPPTSFPSSSDLL